MVVVVGPPLRGQQQNEIVWGQCTSPQLSRACGRRAGRLHPPPRWPGPSVCVLQSLQPACVCAAESAALAALHEAWPAPSPGLDLQPDSNHSEQHILHHAQADGSRISFQRDIWMPKTPMDT